MTNYGVSANRNTLEELNKREREEEEREREKDLSANCTEFRNCHVGGGWS